MIPAQSIGILSCNIMHKELVLGENVVQLLQILWSLLSNVQTLHKNHPNFTQKILVDKFNSFEYTFE